MQPVVLRQNKPIELPEVHSGISVLYYEYSELPTGYRLR